MQKNNKKVDTSDISYETSGLIKSGVKATTKIIFDVPTKSSPIYRRALARFMSEEDFIENHASGTLRKNKRLGFDYKKQYLHERIAFDFGYGFECLHETHINWGAAPTEGDCSSITEAGWHVDRYQFFAFPGDTFEVKYLKIHDGATNTEREGVGLIIRRTSAPYVPTGYVVFSLIAQVDTRAHEYMNAINPF